MGEVPRVKTSQRMDWIRFTAPVTAFVLTTMTIGMIASRHTGGYPRLHLSAYSSVTRFI